MGCSESNSKEKEEKDTKTESVYADVKLKLNDGDKWEMSGVMMTYITQSFYLIEESYRNENTNSKELGKTLNKLKESLVESCDMQGEGHDVLHSWLMPYIDLIDQLQQADDKEEITHIMNELITAKNLFLQHFN